MLALRAADLEYVGKRSEIGIVKFVTLATTRSRTIQNNADFLSTSNIEKKLSPSSFIIMFAVCKNETREDFKNAHGVRSSAKGGLF